MRRKIGDACLSGVDADPEIMRAQAEEVLSERHVWYDTMVGTGMSGSLVVPVLARTLGKDWLIVRKPGERHHHGNEVAQGTLGDRWLMVDDGMDEGKTATRLMEVVPALNPGTTFAGAYFYGDHTGLHAGRFMDPAELRDWIAWRKQDMELSQDPFDRFVRQLQQLA